MLKIGNYVSYRSEGVCVISDIRTESFGTLGGTGEYYILTPLKDANSVLYVPVNNELLVSKMMPLLSADEICALARELRDERIEWKEESRARSYAFRDILSVGDRRELIVLVNTISERIERMAESGKKLTGGDETAFKRAKKMLFEEFSVTADIEDEDTLMMILKGERICDPVN